MSQTQSPAISPESGQATRAQPEPGAPRPPDHNRSGLDFRRPMPRPKVRGPVIDFHCHLLANRHAGDWFAAAAHYGIDCFVSMTPLEEVVGLLRDWGHGGRLQFIAVARWGDALSPSAWVDDFRTRLDAFYNLGSRLVKFHMAPGTMQMRGVRLDSPMLRPIFQELAARKMGVMTHLGDPDTWYGGKYADASKYGSRDQHYAMWESALTDFRDHPWVGAHMGGNTEDLPRLQRMLDTFPNLYLDCSATRWMVREISARRDTAREFFIRNADRILFGTDQVSGDDRGFDFLASRFWAHRKLWETAYTGPSPIFDPDRPEDRQPQIRGLALPDEVLQKMYHDNAVKLMARAGVNIAS